MEVHQWTDKLTPGPSALSNRTACSAGTEVWDHDLMLKDIHFLLDPAFFRFTIQWITFCASSIVPCQGAIAIPPIHRSASERDGRRMGGSMGKPEVLVFRELPHSCSNRRHGSRWGFRRFKWRVCNPGWRRLSLSRSIHSRRRLLALLKGWSLRVLLRNELEQGSCHGWANVPTGTGFRPGLLCNQSWRWSQWRRWTSLVLPSWFYFWCFTIWKRQEKILSKCNIQHLSMTIIFYIYICQESWELNILISTIRGRQNSTYTNQASDPRPAMIIGAIWTEMNSDWSIITSFYTHMWNLLIHPHLNLVKINAKSFTFQLPGFKM